MAGSTRTASSLSKLSKSCSKYLRNPENTSRRRHRVLFPCRAQKVNTLLLEDPEKYRVDQRTRRSYPLQGDISVGVDPIHSHMWCEEPNGRKRPGGEEGEA